MSRRTFKGVSLTGDWELGYVSLRSISAYRNTRYFWQVDVDATTFPISYLARQEKAKQFAQELQLVGESDRFR